MKNITLGIIVGAIVLIAGIFIGRSMSEVAIGASPVGTTFGTAKQAAIVMSFSSSSATSTSILNIDANDRMIQNSFASCYSVGTSQTAYTGAGLAALRLLIATTTTSAPAVLTNTNYAANLIVSTSTPVGYNASSTEGVLTGYSRVWPSNTYLTFQPNATNTATCVVGVNYLQS